MAGGVTAADMSMYMDLFSRCAELRRTVHLVPAGPYRHRGYRLRPDRAAPGIRGRHPELPCAAQAGAVLLALAVTAAWPGAWWLDPAIALGIAAVAVREGTESWRGEDCC
jgi:hypothetical protein